MSKQRITLLLLFLLISLCTFAQGDELPMIPDPTGKTGDWRDKVPVAFVTIIALFLSKQISFGLTEKLKVFLNTHGVKTTILNGAINGVIVALLFLVLGKFQDPVGDLINYLVAVIGSVLRDSGHNDSMIRTSEKALEGKVIDVRTN